MQQENLLKNNNIVVQGKICSEFTFSHEVYGESFYNFFLEVSRLSDVFDILPITISERLIDKTTLPIGTLVNINGQVRSYNNFVETDKRNKLVLTIFTRDIEIVTSFENKNKNPNEVSINGFICKPPIYRTTPFGREIADILVAVNRSYNKSDYIPCISWGRNARFASKINVGDNIKLWGRMQSRNYQKKSESGELVDKVAYEISISKVEFVDETNETNETNQIDETNDVGNNV